jgi:mannose-6-phosphate isomerase-like protein (cupin superfamily)
VLTIRPVASDYVLEMGGGISGEEASRVPEYLERHPAPFNDNDVHVNRIRGEYVWHSHADTDDVFLVLSGR